MNKLLLPGVAAALLAIGASAALPVGTQSAAPEAAEILPGLAWLAGEWRGTVDGAEVVSWHSDPSGGMIVMAGKEVQDGHVRLFDFGVVSERDGHVGYVPHPFGKPSVAFLLTGFDPALKRAAFVNEAHDFPKRFVFELTEAGALRITLTGDEGGQAMEVAYELKPAGTGAAR